MGDKYIKNISVKGIEISNPSHWLLLVFRVSEADSIVTLDSGIEYRMSICKILYPVSMGILPRKRSVSHTIITVMHSLMNVMQNLAMAIV